MDLSHKQGDGNKFGNEKIGISKYFLSNITDDTVLTLANRFPFKWC